MSEKSFKENKIEEFRKQFEDGDIICGHYSKDGGKETVELLENFLSETIDDMDKKVEEAKTQVRDDIDIMLAMVQSVTDDTTKKEVLDMVGEIRSSLKEGSK